MALNHPRFSTNGVQQPGAKDAPLEERNRKANTSLNEKLDQLNQLWASAEAKLSAMQVIRNVWVVYKSEEDDPDDPACWRYEHCLGMIRIKGEWRICLTSYHTWEGDPNSGEEPGDWKPITECPAEARVAVAPYIPKLRLALVESKERFAPRVDTAVENLQKVLEQL